MKTLEALTRARYGFGDSGDVEAVGVLLGVVDGDGVLDEEPVPLGVPLGVVPDEGVPLGVPLGDGVPVPVPDAEPEPVPVVLGDGVAEGVGLGVGSRHMVPKLPVQSTAKLMA